MANVLLVEPDYRSKFPPLGLLRISTFHKEAGDSVTFCRGKVRALREVGWHRIYLSSLFTWELPRTVETVRYYSRSVDSANEIIVGGIGASLYPEYVREHARCRVIEGPVNRPGILAPGSPSISDLPPDYSVLDSVYGSAYQLVDAYFCRATVGCIRRCRFCAVPVLEPTFSYLGTLRRQIAAIRERFGERQNLLLLDNNVLATPHLDQILEGIREEGFVAGATRHGRKRAVDLNQGMDARLVTPQVARKLRTICLYPVRLAFDNDCMEIPYRRAVRILAAAGFTDFVTYVMYNFDDTPQSLYHRLEVGIELSQMLHVRITSFPMRYVPIHDTHRGHVSPGWRWRYLRGVQCMLHATRGLVSPNPAFFRAAFGRDYEDFVETLTMPDRYIMYRDYFKEHGAADWRVLYEKLSPSKREEFLRLLEILNRSSDRRAYTRDCEEFRPLVEHYYPGGQLPPEPSPEWRSTRKKQANKEQSRA